MAEVRRSKSQKYMVTLLFGDIFGSNTNRGVASTTPRRPADFSSFSGHWASHDTNLHFCSVLCLDKSNSRLRVIILHQRGAALSSHLSFLDSLSVRFAYSTSLVFTTALSGSSYQNNPDTAVMANDAKPADVCHFCQR